MVFCLGLLSLGLMCSGFIHVAVFHHFLLWTEHVLFIHSSADGHLGVFHFFTVMNNAAMNIKISVCIYVFISLGHIHR